MSAIKDLSTIHSLITDLFRMPASESEWQQYALSPEQINFFNVNGYLGGIKLLEDWQVEALRNELDEIADPKHPAHALYYEFHSNESTDTNTVLFHALGAWRIGPGFHDVLWNPRYLMAASQLLGNKPLRFWHDQLFCKPARHGAVVAWHQDYSYWTRTRPIAHLTCWCGLDDSTEENGCLQYVPGSQNWGLLEKPVLAGDLMGIKDYLSAEQLEAFKPIPVETKAGEAIFHHALTLHGSGENKSDRPRRAFVINAFADGVVSDSDDVLLESVPPIPKGVPMQGQFFPLLFDPAKLK
ncbi:MAG TPA: phytanoyl-CoA dioxygenase family protein [Chitinophagaceae bacterium]|nr:phytanoyl-CoA dioxygenase family protein [Chitinophagaceae bacterium]